MKRIKIVHLLTSEIPVNNVLIKGWVRTRRDSKDFSFIEVNDGSCLKNVQIIADSSLPNYPEIARLSTGSAVIITGDLVESKGAGQKW
ncbi:MAG: OB-fold nucleic acid binding domain-containing protein, partial [Desulfobacterales bacterium]